MRITYVYMQITHDMHAKMKSMHVISKCMHSNINARMKTSNARIQRIQLPTNRNA
jgi:hypothetical protein